MPFEVEDTAVKANTVVTAYGQRESRIYLLNKGLMQITTRKGEKERILEFVFPGNFFCAYTSFLQEQLSDVEISTLTTCEVSVVNSSQLKAATQSSLLASHLSLYIAQQLFLSRAKREKDFLTLSAEERYRKLFAEAPDIIRLLPGNKIAKYLGIQPESLSRIRKSVIP